jgi:HSP20 family protein
MSALLKKWDPFRELSTLHREMDEIFKRGFGAIAPGWFRGEWYPSLESYTKGGNLIIKADLPGVDPKEVSISVVDDRLTIKGERKEKREEREGECFFCETSYGRFERTVTLPEGVDTEKIKASYKNGVLEITMPAKVAALPKKVEVKVEE